MPNTAAVFTLWNRCEEKWYIYPLYYGFTGELHHKTLVIVIANNHFSFCYFSIFSYRRAMAGGRKRGVKKGKSVHSSQLRFLESKR